MGRERRTINGLKREQTSLLTIVNRVNVHYFGTIMRPLKSNITIHV